VLSGHRQLVGQGVGLRPSLRRKTAADFLEHRAYVPGDDVRFVDWRASARHEAIFVKQGELPQEIAVLCLLDTSASMAWGDPPKNAGQLMLAASLSYLTLANGDRIFLFPYGERAIAPLGPTSGKSQTKNLLNYLNRVLYGGESNLMQAARRLANRFSRGGILFILSDLLSVPNLSSVLGLFPPPHWHVHVIQTLHPHEVEPTVSGNLQMVDSELGVSRNLEISPEALSRYKEELDQWQSEVELTCIQNYATHTMIPSNWDHAAVYARLREAHILGIQ
jgi:uncharacterized protein (DUF58 family)